MDDRKDWALACPALTLDTYIVQGLRAIQHPYEPSSSLIFAPIDSHRALEAFFYRLHTCNTIAESRVKEISSEDTCAHTKSILCQRENGAEESQSGDNWAEKEAAIRALVDKGEVGRMRRRR